jgi:hypothetical protein
VPLRGFVPWAFEPVANRNTDYACPAQDKKVRFENCVLQPGVCLLLVTFNTTGRILGNLWALRVEESLTHELS